MQLFGGGGVRSEDLKGIPQSIRNMVNQYSKVAMGNLNIDMPINRGASSTYTIKTNANFEIKNAIVFLQNINQDKAAFGIDLKNYQTPKIIYFEDYYWRQVSLKVQNKNQIILKVEAMDYQYIGHFKISHWIAIG